jgi:hypothetical protein
MESKEHAEDSKNGLLKMTSDKNQKLVLGKYSAQGDTQIRDF